MKILCYGDSNTYGWDPRYFSGNHYPHPWPELLGERTGHITINSGEPGRVIPCRKETLAWFCRDVQANNPDLLVIMLGTNDLFYSADATADAIAERMENLVHHAITHQLSKKLLLLSCPKVNGSEAPLLPVLRELSEKYRVIAEQMDIDFADPFRWDIPLAFDGVHFTEEGHRVFADEIIKVIRK